LLRRPAIERGALGGARCGLRSHRLVEGGGDALRHTPVEQRLFFRLYAVQVLAAFRLAPHFGEALHFFRREEIATHGDLIRLPEITSCVDIVSLLRMGWRRCRERKGRNKAQ
jgi:hypothetical protein